MKIKTVTFIYDEPSRTWFVGIFASPFSEVARKRVELVNPGKVWLNNSGQLESLNLDHGFVTLQDAVAALDEFVKQDGD